MNYIFFASKIPLLSELSLASLRKWPRNRGFKTAYYFASNVQFDSLDKTDDDINSSSSARGSLHCDTFGALRKPLEKRINNKSQSSSLKYKNKHVIKMKYPHKDESDTFGNLSDKKPVWYPIIEEPVKEDNDQSDDGVLVKNFSKKHRCPKKYLEEMKRLVNERKMKDALDLFVDMRRNFVTPLHPHFTFMIGACGRIGYTEMAFKLFRQMTDRAYTPTPATLTGLFNSCAESPFPEYSLKKAQLLKEKVEMKHWLLTQPTYHSMIKAFGRCGDLQTAFQIVDEMATAKVKINTNTFNFLLMSCITNKEAGFTYAVEVWRKMKNKGCPPDTFTCNLLLRATRDCDVGPEEISSLLLQHWSSYSKRPYGLPTGKSLTKPPLLKIKSGSESNATEDAEYVNLHTANEETKNLEYQTKESTYELLDAIPMKSVVKNPENTSNNLLADRPVNGPEILELVNIKTASDRLSLIGGMEGFIDFMFSAKVKPTIKTYTLLLECLPPNIEVEEKLLSIIDTRKVKPDIDFFNILIKRRCFRREDDTAKGALVLINKYELTPNIMTFGTLALGCRNLHQASLILSDMKKLGSSPNIEILGSMLRNAFHHLNFSYMKFVLEVMETEDIKPNEKFLLDLEKVLSETRKNIILLEQGKEVHSFYQRENLSTEYKKFSDFYEDWSKRMEVEIDRHPWLQYKTDIIDRVKPEQLN